MIFNKDSHHDLSRCFSWSTVTCSSAGLHGFFQLRFSVFAFVFQVAVVSLSSLCCWFLSLNVFGVSSSSWLFGAGDLIGFLATVVRFLPPHPPTFFPSTYSLSVDGCLKWGLMAGLRGFASHVSSILSKGWLATVDAPGYPRHPPFT